MKSAIFIALPLIAGLFLTCKKDVAEPTRLTTDEVNQKSHIAYGQVVFWAQSSSQAGVLFVNIGELRQSVTYTTNAPACGDNGYATYKLPVGDYTYAITTSTYNNNNAISKSANGTVSITDGGCEAIEFK